MDKPSAPGIVLTATAVSFLNEWYSTNDSLPNFRIPIAGGLFALFTAGLENINPQAARGLAYIMFITVLVTPFHRYDGKGGAKYNASPLGTLSSLAISKPANPATNKRK